MTTEKRFVNPFIEAAKNAAANPKVPFGKTQQVQQAKLHNQVSSNKPSKRSSGRGR